MGHPTVLLVDDEEEALDLGERSLRENYNVIRASSAAEALKRLRLERVDILVTDHKMPGMTGLEMLEQVKDRYPDMVKVLVTGMADVPDIQVAIERCNIQQCVLKPIDRGSLQRAVRDAYERRSGWTLGAGTGRIA